MKLIFIIFGILLAASCSKAEELDKCISTDNSYYINVLSSELAKRNIRHTNPTRDKVCYSSSNWLEFDQADAYIHSFYRNVAAKFNSSKTNEVNEFKALLRNKGKVYESSVTDTGDIFLVIYSSSPDEEKENRMLLNEIK